MNQRVTLEYNGKQDEIIARETHMANSVCRFTGVDPSNVPERYHDGVQFRSRDLAMIVYDGSGVDVVSVEPTEESPADVEPTW